MGEKKNKNLAYWNCIYCSYKGNRETLIEQGYMFEIKNGIKVCECPRCNSQQEAK